MYFEQGTFADLAFRFVIGEDEPWRNTLYWSCLSPLCRKGRSIPLCGGHNVVVIVLGEQLCCRERHVHGWLRHHELARGC